MKMKTMSRLKHITTPIAASLVLLAVACGGTEEAPVVVAPTSAPVPTLTAAPVATATSVPTAVPAPIEVAAPTAAPTPAAAVRRTGEKQAMYLGGLGRTGSFDTTPAVLGEVKWKFKMFPNTSGSPTVAQGVVYQGSSTRLFAVEADSGEELWRFETDGIIRGSPAVSDAVVYIGSADGRLYAVDAVTGEEKWRFQTGDKVYSSPAVVDGVVYVGSQDRHLYAVDVATGRERWRFQIEDTDSETVAIVGREDFVGVYSSPAIAGDAVYFGAWDGNIYSLDLTTGQERWRLSPNPPMDRDGRREDSGRG